MKAAQISQFGEPDVLRINEVDRPVPGGGEVLVLVLVEATSVNGHDMIVRAGGLKMVSGRKFPLGTGLDFAGLVVAAGPGTEGYRAGDRVWGTVHPRERHITGAAAEYVTVPALAAIGLSTIHGSRRIRTFSANADTALLRDLAGYVTSGALRPVVSGVFPLAEIAAAHQAFSRGGILGKHVIAVAG